MGLALTELHKLPGYKEAPRIWRGGVRVLDPEWVKEATNLYRLFGASEPLSLAEERARALVIQDNHRPPEPSEPPSKETVLGDIGRLHAAGRLTSGMLLVKMAQAYGFTPNELRGESRKRELVFARHHAMYEMKRLLGMSLPQIGRRFGGFDHTTCLWAIRQWPKKAASAGIPCEPLKEPT